VCAGGPCGLQDAIRSCLQVEPRNVGGDAALEQLDVLGQITDMLAERTGRPVLERRGQTPTSARASVDLPDPLGPMIPTASPLRNSNETSLRICLSELGAPTWSCSTTSDWVGGGSARGSSSAGKSFRS
jgi:hypothetical protein